MKKEKRIKIGGMSQSLPPAISPDGESSLLINLQCDKEVWRPIKSPCKIYTPSTSEQRHIHIHVNDGYKHMFTYNDQTLRYEAREEEGAFVALDTPEVFEITHIDHIESLGNTLTAFTSEAIYYLIFRDGRYHMPGQRPEFPELSFSLGDAKTQIETWSDYTLSTPLTSDNGYRLTDGDKIGFSSLVYGSYSRVRNALSDEGYITSPCLVRYALRLYDGSYIYPSAPVLLCPQQTLSFDNNLVAPVTEKDEKITRLGQNSIAVTGEKIIYTIERCDLSQWHDIVKGIDIFLSRELNLVRDETIENNYYISREKDSDGNECKVFRYKLPLINNDAQREAIINESLYYKVATIDIDDITVSSDATIVLNHICSLNDLIHQPTLPLDNFSLHTMQAHRSYVYNGRLHIGDITTRFYEGYPLSIFSIKQERYHNYTLDDIYIEYGYIRVTLQGTTQSYLVSYIRGESYKLSAFVSYPDSRATSIEIVGYGKNGELVCYRRLPLHTSPNENRAYYLSPDFAPIDLSICETMSEEVTFVQQNIEEYTPGKMRVSALYNPFVFPQENTYMVSQGAIIGMAATSAALSQGQYGEFPLYVFTTDGIWAMQHGDNTTVYATIHPVNREIALSSRHIVSVDDAVIYLSAQGVMALRGSEVSLLSSPFSGVADSLPANITNATEGLSFFDFMLKANIGYDYFTKELLFLCPDCQYIRVYDLSHGTWSLQNNRYSTFYALYPLLLARGIDGNIYDCSHKTTNNEVDIAWVSRAIKLLPDKAHRLQRCTLRCCEKAKLELSLWGSNRAENGYGCIARYRIDGDIPGRITLHPVSPAYKYHRIAITGTVSAQFHLDCIDIEYEEGV